MIAGAKSWFDIREYIQGHHQGNFSRWTGLRNIIMVKSFRYKKGKSIGLEYRYYISSKTLTAEQAANAVRER